MNGRAQWETKQATLLGEKQASLEGLEWSSQVPFLLAERARSECARSTRAVKGSLGYSLENWLGKLNGLAHWQQFLN